MEEFFRLSDMNMLSDSLVNVLPVENDARITGTAADNNNTSGDGGGGGDFHGGPILLNDGNFNMRQFDNDQDMDELHKIQIVNHPRYSDLISAYIDCHKFGAPPEIETFLEETGRRLTQSMGTSKTQIGEDPELDQFMESFCGFLRGWKEEMETLINGTAAFLSDIESQLNDLCSGTFQTTGGWNYHSSADEVIGSSEEELSNGELEAFKVRGESSSFRLPDSKLKETLLHKYSGYLAKLVKDFLKTRKKGKLPKNAKNSLMDWWNSHNTWPYPTDEEKMHLSMATGLDQKQINNWFINQRKRHWKPSEDMKFAIMEGVNGRNVDGSGGEGGGGTSYGFDTTGFGNGDIM